MTLDHRATTSGARARSHAGTPRHARSPVWSPRPVAIAAALAVAAGGWMAPGSVAAQGAGGSLPPTLLPVLRGVVAGQVVVNAPAPGATAARMTIDQASQRAIIDWRSFNIGRDAEVLFRHQQGASASTLNRIFDVDPSVIQGRLRSEGALGADGKPGVGGQVILINQNGILFDRGAQVNSQSLLASTLGLLQTPEQFCGGNLSACNTGIPLTAGGLQTPLFGGGYDDGGAPLPARPDGRRPGTIGIGSFGSASAEPPRLVAGNGGSIIVVASRIDHDAGLIAAPDGQVVLAAGARAYLALNEDATDLTLRGFRVEVEAQREGPGLNLTNLVRNAATITADRGNVTLAALAINQEGRISAATAVQRNGSVYLQARDRASAAEAQAGTLRLASGSVTEVMPDRADPATLPESASYAPYRGEIRASAGRIESHGTLLAPGGRIGLEAGDATDPAAARVYLGSGSLTSVAGLWSEVDPAKNFVTFRVTSNELKNAPDQKGGLLAGATVTVDLREGSPLLALDGYRDAVARTVAEKAAVGGELSIASSGDVIQRAGATIDASGGGYRYGASRVATSQLLGDDGRIYDIGSAPQQRGYVAQLDRVVQGETRWSQSRTTIDAAVASGSVREAYVEGQRAGTVRIGSGNGLVLDGALEGGVTIGPRQFARAPAAGTLYIGTGLQPLTLDLVDQPPVFVTYNAEGQRIGDVTFAATARDTLGAAFGADGQLSPARRAQVTIGASQVFGPSRSDGSARVERAFGTVEINSDGRINLPADVALQAPSGASLTLRGPAIEIAGDIRLPAGTLTLAPQLEGGVDLIDPSLAERFERIVVRGSSTLSLAGEWLNDSGVGGASVGERLPSGRAGSENTATSTLDGGRFAIRLVDEAFQTLVERGALIDVSGGAALDAARRVSGGRGGVVTLATGSANPVSSDWMQGELRGHALAGGSTLTLNVNRAVLDDGRGPQTLPADTIRVDPANLGAAGFASITVTAPAGIVAGEGERIELRVAQRVVDGAQAASLPSGADPAAAARIELLPLHRRAPGSLTLNATVGSISVGRDTVIGTDPGGTLAFTAGSGLRVDGSLLVPGGRITLAVRGSEALDASPLALGRDSRVSVAGVYVPTPNDAGLRQGNVLGGGTVTLDARQAAVHIDEGARVDVSGIEQALDLPGAGAGAPTRSAPVAGHAGTLVVRAQRGLRIDGALVAKGPGSAAGGSFALELTRVDGQETLPAAQRLVVSADGADRQPAAGGPTTTSVLDAGALGAAGFEKLRLLSEDRIELQGTLALDFERGLRLDAPVLDLAPGANVSLSAANVALGQSLGVRVLAQDARNRQVWTRVDTLPQPERTPGSGSGVLRVAADTLDLYGSSVVQGTSLIRLASDADTRFIGREVNFNPAQGNDPSLVYQYGSLDVAGALELRAAQIYPATRTRFEVETHGIDSYLLVAPSGGRRGDVYSAGGRLSLSAPTLVQSGVVLAPQGELLLSARDRLELAAGSTTSVSGAGRTVLYGGTLDGVRWRYVDGPQTDSVTNPRLLDAITTEGKRLELRAPVTEVAAGATVDLRGGGDVLAVEFVPGSGGDTDIANAADTFAIIPQSRLSSIPYDTFVQLAGGRDPGSGFSLANPRDAALYDSLQISEGSPVAAGEYVLLPTRFALLPGASLVQLQTTSAWRNLQPGVAGALPNGERVVAGWRSARGTDLRESQSVGVVVLPGAAVSRYSDYTLSGSRLLADQAARDQRALPASPWDAGRLALLDARRVELTGEFLTQAAASGPYAGREAWIDITGPRIALVDRSSPTPPADGTLELSAATLSRVNASVLVGGTRTREAAGDGRGEVVRVRPDAERVSVTTSSGSPVELPELLLAARESIEVAAGSVLRARAAEADEGSAAPPEILRTDAFGALLRLSSRAQVEVRRDGVDTSRGEIAVAPGAALDAERSLLLDASRSTRADGTLRAGAADGSGGSISLAAARIAAGELPATGVDGLLLRDASLSAFAGLETLTLKAYERIDLFGDARLGSAALRRLELDSPRLEARPVAGVADALIEASTLRWTNSAMASSATAPATPGGGRLELRAAELVLGAGDKSSAGYGDLRLNAAAGIDLEGRGTLRAGGRLDVVTPVLRAIGGADQRLVAEDGSRSDAGRYGAVRVISPSAAVSAARDATTPGGRLLLQGASVTVETAIEARSGRIALQAMDAGVGVVDLGAGARLDAGGWSRDFNGSVAAAAGGEVALSSPGAVRVREGARIDVSAAAAGGDAGRAELHAGSLTLAGTLSARADADARGGEVWLDLARLEDFSTLNAALDSGGFTSERLLRLRSGDLRVAPGDSIGATRVSLSADQGSIAVEGTVGRASAAGGARIDIHAGGDLALRDGARVVANGLGAGAGGGEVRMSSRSGSVTFEPGAAIDVRAGDGGSPGAVIFDVARAADGSVAPTRLQGQVLRYSAGGLAARGIPGADAPARITLEATRTLSGNDVPSSIGAPQVAAWAQQNQAFLAASAARGDGGRLAGLRDEVGAVGDGRVVGALQLQASGSLTLAANWDLTADAWRAGDRAGTLTLRAAGDLTLNQTIGAPNAPNLPPTNANAQANSNINTSNHAILGGDTWHLRLAAGADLAAADPLATRGAGSTVAPAAGGGSLVLATAAAGLRTGTGRIDIAAAQDLRLLNSASAIYTAGRIGAADTATNGNDRWAVDGGGISVRVGGAVAGAANTPDLWVTDWLRRLRQTDPQFRADGFLTDWWSFRPRFQQGVGTLAGGDIDVRAGGDVSDLIFALPTSGRTTRVAGARTVEVNGGGDLSLRAGGAVEGASFLVGRGSARVEAGADIGARQPVQGYLMGVSSGALPERATLTLAAGGSVTLQSVDNPTMMGLNGGAGAVGPSFHPTTAATASPSSIATSFFTYAAGSAVALLAEAGDAAIIGRLARETTSWRSITSLNANNLPAGASTAFPARVAAISFGGDVLGPGAFELNRGQPNLIRTYPSAGASLIALAAGDLREFGAEVSDLDPRAMITPTRNFESARLQANGSAGFFNTGPKVSSETRPITLGRIVEREGGLPFGLVAQTGSAADLSFDLQAATGSAVFETSPLLALPARSRLRVAQDILDPFLQLQNLEPGDVTEVRAERGRIAKSGGAGGLEIAGPGRLLLQAGGDIDIGNATVAANGVIIGGLVATGNTRNPLLKSTVSARLTVLAGVEGDVDLARLAPVYERVQTLNRLNAPISSLYAQLDLEGEAGRAAVLGAANVAALAARDPVYARFVELDRDAPEALAAYQRVLRDRLVPAPGGADAAQAQRLLALLAREDDVARMAAQPTLGAYLTSLAAAGGTSTDNPSAITLGGERIDPATVAAWTELGERYPRLFAGATVRRTNGARLTGTVPLVFDELLGGVVAGFVPTPSAGGGSIFSFQTSIQTLGGSDIDLWAPRGDIVVGLTTPSGVRPVGVLTNQGGAVRSVLGGDFAINTGKVLTAQGGDILIYSAAGSIDAGRGAKTSLSTPPPQRRPILDAEGNQVGVEVVIPASAAGSGIQTLTSDPDGLGPAIAPAAGDIYLFAPAGRIDAGEAGIRSSGNILINAQVVLNASDIRAAGASQGVPQVPAGSLATSLAAAGAGSSPAAQSEERAARAADQAARQASAAQRAPRPTILSVEVLGFGERNCREDDRECLGR